MKSIFLDLFKQKSYECAIKYVNILKYNLDEFPTFLAKYLKQESFPRYKKFLTYLENPHKGKIDSTNKKTENYIVNTMFKVDKNKLQTSIGFMNPFYHRSNNWVKNRKFQLTN